MFYDEPVFRPPSEADSLILQVTIGCAHNACAFCGMYKGKRFRIRKREEVFRDIRETALLLGRRVRRVFLADGDALVCNTGELLELLDFLYQTFPDLERVSSYAGPRDLLAKGTDELQKIRAAGLKMLYLGVESGDDELLAKMGKGVDAAGMVEAGRRAIEAGFDLSVTIITGLGGRERSRTHALATARVINEINPPFLAALTLMVVENTPLARWVAEGKFTPLNALESLQEIRWLLEALAVDKCVFRCNHASNYLPLKGELNRDREHLLELLDRFLKNPARNLLRPEYARGL